MHPRRPHGHRRPSSLTTTWPISPPALRPTPGFPSSTMPPPPPLPQNTPSPELYGCPPPVPQNTPSTELYGCAAPIANSPSVATCTTLPIATGGPRASSSTFASGNVPSQSGRLRALVTVPALPSTSPGEPTPTPASAAGSTPAACAASVSVRTIASATSCGPPVVGVSWRDSPSTP